jgi:hypothetical protein
VDERVEVTVEVPGGSRIKTSGRETAACGSTLCSSPPCTIQATTASSRARAAKTASLIALAASMGSVFARVLATKGGDQSLRKQQQV